MMDGRDGMFSVRNLGYGGLVEERGVWMDLFQPRTSVSALPDHSCLSVRCFALPPPQGISSLSRGGHFGWLRASACAIPGR
jgi:hypothetical protein